MGCKNHPEVRAKRRCYACKARICPRCQFRQHRHLFCSQECADAWKLDSDNKDPQYLKVGRQLDQLLDLIDASLEQTRAVLEERLVGRVQRLEGELGHRLDGFNRQLEGLLTGISTRLDAVERQLQAQHDGGERAKDALKSAAQESLRDGESRWRDGFQQTEKSIGALLEQARLNFYRGMELTRERVADLFANSSDQLREQLNERDEALERLGEKQSDAIGTLLDGFESRIGHNTKDALDDAFSENINDMRDAVSERLESMHAEQQQRLESIHDSMKGFVNEDLKRVATEIKFLDRFLERFRQLAEEERRDFQQFLQAGNERLAQSIAKIEEQGKQLFAQNAQQVQKRYDSTLTELRTAAIDKLRLIPKSFRLSASSYALLGCMLLAAVASPIVVYKLRTPTQPTAPAAVTEVAPEAKAAVVSVSHEAQTGHNDTFTIPAAQLSRPASFKQQNLVAGSRQKKQLAITFDGGSNSRAATEILDILRAKKITCTIFLTGEFILNYPEITRQIFKDGHEVGNHTWNHPNLVAELTAADRAAKKLTADDRRQLVQKQLLDTERLYTLVTGQPMIPLWRAPYGAYNAEVLQLAKDAGYTHVHWTDDTRDWVAERNNTLYLTAEQIKQRILSMDKRPEGANGGIILMHLGSERLDGDQPYRYLAEIIDTMRNKGYQFVRVSQLLQ